MRSSKKSWRKIFTSLLKIGMFEKKCSKTRLSRIIKFWILFLDTFWTVFQCSSLLLLSLLSLLSSSLFVLSVYPHFRSFLSFFVYFSLFPFLSDTVSLKYIFGEFKCIACLKCFSKEIHSIYYFYACILKVLFCIYKMKSCFLYHCTSFI